MPSMPAVFEGRIFDGKSARPRVVEARLEGDHLVFGEEAIDLAQVRRVESSTGLTLHRLDDPDWRMILPKDAKGAFGDIAKFHAVTARHWRMIGSAVAGVAAIGGFVWFFGSSILTLLAPLVPHRVSEGVGEQYVAIFAPDERQCHNPAGQRALNKIVGRILPQRGLVEPVRVTVVDDPTVNAITLPGGQVLLFKGLLDQAESADEIAGVLAHEFGHVQHYHGNQALIRHFGLGVFLEGIGGNIGSAASTGLFLSNSRAAEREADGEAITLLRNGEVSALGVSNFFARVGTKRGDGKKGEKGEAAATDTDIIDLVSTHPGDADRRKRFAEAARSYGATPVLTDPEWQALRRICAK